MNMVGHYKRQRLTLRRSSERNYALRFDEVPLTTVRALMTAIVNACCHMQSMRTSTFSQLGQYCLVMSDRK